MDVASSLVIDIVGPAALLVVLIWLAVHARSNRSRRDEKRSEQATRALYQAEDQRRRDGTDQL